MSAATVKINSKRFMALPPLPGNLRQVTHSMTIARDLGKRMIHMHYLAVFSSNSHQTLRKSGESLFGAPGRVVWERGHSWLLCTSSAGWSSDLPSRACWYTRCVPRARASSIHRDSEKSSSRKPALPDVSTARISFHRSEYSAPGPTPGAGRMGA